MLVEFINTNMLVSHTIIIFIHNVCLCLKTKLLNIRKAMRDNFKWNSVPYFKIERWVFCVSVVTYNNLILVYL